VNSRKMSWGVYVAHMGQMKKCLQGSDRKPAGKKQRYRWKDIKMNLWEMGYKGKN
jgi:hypothetical protein